MNSGQASAPDAIPEKAPGQGMGPMFGPNADESFVTDRDTFHSLLNSHDKIDRSVMKLPTGVTTITTSSDKEVATKIREHVEAMYARVKEHRPIRVRDPLFAELFRQADKIDMKVEPVDGGVRVTETSEDPYVVQLIHSHAGVVSAFVEYGFAEARKNHAVPTDESAPMLNNEQTQHALELSARLDRVYIPALALTNQGKKDAGQKAVARLAAEAPALTAEMAQTVGVEPGQWLLAKEVDKAIREAQSLVGQGQLAQAHGALEPLRNMLLDERRRLGVDYPVDVLSDFHEVMEKIVMPASKAQPTDVDDAMIASLKALSVEASASWSRVEQTDFNLPCFVGLDARKLDTLIADERAALTELHRALRGRDADKILKSARALKPTFARVYTAFGDFHP